MKVRVVCCCDEADDGTETVTVKVTGMAADQAHQVADRLEHPIRLVILSVYKKTGWRERQKPMVQ